MIKLHHVMMKLHHLQLFCDVEQIVGTSLGHASQISAKGFEGRF